MKYTVEVQNKVLGSLRFVGTFDTAEEAREYRDVQAARSRNFAVFRVWTKRGKEPIDPVGDPIAGAL